MKTILLPTDFSSHSERALEFAIEIAKRSNASILVAHAYQVPLIDSNMPASIMDSMLEEERNIAEEKLNEISTRISLHTSSNGNKLQCSYEAEFNMPLSEIAQLSKERNVDLIIMGTEDKEVYFNLMIGSTTEDVVNHVSCPVLVVKTDTPYNYFQQIFFAIENFKTDLLTLQQLIPFARLFNSEITLLHIAEYATSIEDLSYNNENEATQTGILNSLKDSLQYTNIGIRYGFADEVTEGVQRISHAAQPDLLVLLKYKRSWIENIFHKSVIHQEIRNAKTPLLILHKEE